MLEFKLVYANDGYMAARAVREDVFIGEQGVSHDHDEKDDISWHVVGYDGEKLISAARMFPKSEGVFVIGRVAVAKEYRKMYIGDTMLRMLEDKAVRLRGYAIEIGAQKSAVGFYEKEGYVKTGEEYQEEGIHHFKMTKDLTKPFKRCKNCR